MLCLAAPDFGAAAARSPDGRQGYEQRLVYLLLYW
jgi:hypothetical protein